MKINHLRSLLFVLFILSTTALTSACGTLDIGVEKTPTTDRGSIGTAVAYTREASNAQGTAQPTNTPEQTIVPTPENTLTPVATTTTTPAPASVSPYAGIVYRSGDQLLRIADDGKPTNISVQDPQVLPGQFSPLVSFSSDMKYMISWWDFSDLWLVNLKTGEVTNLTNTSDRVEYSAQFWPSHPDTIIFMSQAVADQGPSAGYLTTMQLDGTGYRVLDETTSSIGLPALSPDGQTIAYDRGGEAWLYRWDSGPEQLNLSSFHVNGSLKMANPTWSLKGKYLAWMATTDPGSPDYQSGVALFDIETSGYRFLHPFQSLGHGGWYPTPVWSPDGAWLAIHDESQAQPGIWILHPDGSGASLVYAASTSRSVDGLGVWWSPDSKQLLIYDPNAEGGLRVDMRDIIKGQDTSLPFPSGAFPLAWLH